MWCSGISIIRIRCKQASSQNDVKILIFPIPISFWSVLKIFKENRGDPRRNCDGWPGTVCWEIINTVTQIQDVCISFCAPQSVSLTPGELLPEHISIALSTYTLIYQKIFKTSCLNAKYRNPKKYKILVVYLPIKRPRTPEHPKPLAGHEIFHSVCNLWMKFGNKFLTHTFLLYFTVYFPHN